MKNKILIVKNIAHENPGLLEEVLQKQKVGWDIADLNRGEKFPHPENYRALVVLGGPDSANDVTVKMKDEIQKVREAVEAGQPYLGICLGMQVLVKAAGGQVIRSPVKEVGFYDAAGEAYRVRLTPEGLSDPLLAGLDQDLRVFQLHGETVCLKSGMVLLGAGKHCPHQIVRAGKKAYGIQCHFELTREMLSVWHERDIDLRGFDQSELMRQFDSIAEVYTVVGRKLCENFIKIAGF